MNVEVTKHPGSRVSLAIELTPEEVQAALDRTYKQLVQRVNVPGFRRGKAPRPVVERMVGQEFFLHEASDEAVRWGYRKAVDEANLIPIDEAEIEAGEHDHVHAGESFQFEATVTVKPEVQLPDLHTIRVEREVVEVTEDDVDQVLEVIRQRNATLEPVRRPAQATDVVTMNIVAKVGGEEILNQENFDYRLAEQNEAGEPSDEIFPGLSLELIGSSPGDIKEPVLTMPADGADEETAGKALFIRALVKEVKRQVLPEVNDEFAQSVSELETVGDLREMLQRNLTLERRFEADERLVSEAIEAVNSRSFVEIPPVLIEEELDRELDDFRTTFERQRLTLEAYLESVQKTEEDLRAEMTEDATKNVKTSLVLGAVADRENIDVTTKEVDAALEEILRAGQLPPAERKRLRSSTAVRSNVRTRLRRRLAIQRLVEIVSGGEEVDADAAEAISDQTAGVAEDTEETVAIEVGG